MSLLGGLIFEGMSETLNAFQQLTKDEQVNVVQNFGNELKVKIQRINETKEEIKTDKMRENISLVLDELNQEIEDALKDAKGNPVKAFLVLLSVPVRLMFKMDEIFWGSLYGWLLNMFYPKGPVSAEQARLNAIEFFTLVGDLNLIASIFDIIGDIQILGTKLPGRAIARLITNISWTFGLGWMTWVVMSPVLRASIAEQIRELYEYGIDNIDEYEEELKDAGYSDDKIQKLKDLMKKMVWRDEIRRWITDMAAAYVKGYITDDELMRAIELGYYTNEERQFRYWEERTRRETKIIDLRIDEIERAFKSGEIDENEARARLSEYIVEPRLIEAYIALWKQYRKPEELIDPLEEAQYRLERLKIRIEGLEKQIMHLEVVKQQQLDVYDAEIEELRARLEARIAAAKEEFAAYANKTISEIQARILYYESLIPAATGLTRLRYEAAREMLAAIAEARIEEREAKLNALIEKWTKETEAKIKTIQEKKEKYEAEMDMRIEQLKNKLEEYELEKTATEKVIERLRARA